MFRDGWPFPGQEKVKGGPDVCRTQRIWAASWPLRLRQNDKLALAPRVALSRLTPPGRKRSKGNWALVGARGVFLFHEGIESSTGRQSPVGSLLW